MPEPDFPAPDTHQAVQAHYLEARARLLVLCGQLESRDSLLANLRLALFVAGVLAALGTVWGVVALALSAFVVLVVVHARTVARLEQARHALAVCDEGLARISGTWQGQGRDGAEQVPPHHPYAEDLDLFGPGSLFVQLNTCRTSLGETQLAQWLLSGAARETAEARSGAVRELAAMPELRATLAGLGRPKRVDMTGESLQAWATAPAAFAGRGWRLWCGVNAVLCLLAIGVGLLLDTFAAVMLLASLNLLALGLLRRRLAAQLAWAEATERQWQRLGRMVAVFEAAQFSHGRLRDLQAVLRNPVPASRCFHDLDRLVYYLQMPLNVFFLPVALLTLWPVYFGMRLDAWRHRHGPRFAAWLAAMGELEALAALGTYAFEHPEHAWPEFVEQTCFEAEGLAHPLLPRGTRVANDIHLEEACRLLVISGSNMSGKSTLLRSIGINAVLAMAGVPVCARRLVLSPVAVGATMRVHDSIQEGASRFYAEILRLRQLLELAVGPRPLLYLCDEILHGTNSHDRLAGARAVIQAFQNAAAIGAISTHDLALTGMVEQLKAAENVHLQDDLAGDRLCFDYRLRPGVVEKSNALALMRGAGLPV